MGRIRQMINVHGRPSWTLFGSSARNTYIVPEVAAKLVLTDNPRVVRTSLGGGVKEASKSAVLVADVEGLPIETHALVIDKIGEDEEGKPVEVLFGALAMQQWGIRLIPEQEKLDMTHYPTEFVEF
jgi:hypothetical protein